MTNNGRAWLRGVVTTTGIAYAGWLGLTVLGNSSGITTTNMMLSLHTDFLRYHVVQSDDPNEHVCKLLGYDGSP